MQKKLVLVLAIVAIWFVFFRDGQVSLGPGIFVADSPAQEKIATGRSYPVDEYTITPLAKFNIKAKVLAKKYYRWGREADVSPVDVALGWGRMSDESVLEAIDISQSNRWYRWKTDDFPIPRKEIETHSANMHLIPADKYVESMIDKIHTGQIIEISGNLVRIDAQDGWNWVSSLSRDDTGSHACEVVWVNDIEIKEF